MDYYSASAQKAQRELNTSHLSYTALIEKSPLENSSHQAWNLQQQNKSPVSPADLTAQRNPLLQSHLSLLLVRPEVFLTFTPASFSRISSLLLTFYPSFKAHPLFERFLATPSQVLPILLTLESEPLGPQFSHIAQISFKWILYWWVGGWMDGWTDMWESQHNKILTAESSRCVYRCLG